MAVESHTKAPSKREPYLYALVNFSKTPAKASPFKGRWHGAAMTERLAPSKREPLCGKEYRHKNGFAPA
jgi:hypothetical protein